MCVAGLSGCTQEFPEEKPSVAGTAQQLRAGRGRAGDVYLGSDLLVTDQKGRAISCAAGSLTANVTAQVGATGESVALPAASVHVTCDEAPSDVAIVVDNSGSQQSTLPLIQAAARELGHPIIDAGGRVSLVRVSTNASKLSDLSDSNEDLEAVIESLWVNRGWTALYDGIRVANETLGGGAEGDPRKLLHSDELSFSTASNKLAIVAVTDGGDNNSSAERLLTDADDSLNTTFEDLLKLNVYGVTTPIHTVGIGKKVDNDLLRKLSAASGGIHVEVASYKELPEVFAAFSEYSAQSYKVSSTLPMNVCGDLKMEIDYVFESVTGELIEGHRVEELHVECGSERLSGRSATMLLGLSSPGLDVSVARGLITRTVDYVSPSLNPRVAVVLDDNHHGELSSDADFIAEQMRVEGYRVTRLDEPEGGYDIDAFADYDVVWFSNPGYPVDDESTMRALNALLAAGGGIVLQGDDMAQSFGNAFSMTPYTRLEFLDNGTRFCGRNVDNNAADSYTVTFNEGPHPILAGVGGTSFLYGDDIDNTRPLNQGEEVLAWASAPWSETCGRIPVIIVYDPPAVEPEPAPEVEPDAEPVPDVEPEPVQSSVWARANEGKTLKLACPKGQVVTSIDFASYGTAKGEGPAFEVSSCHSSSSNTVVSNACLGEESCALSVGNGTFRGNPCGGNKDKKSLAVAVTCTER